MIITEEFLKTVKCCDDGIKFAIEHNIIGQDHVEAIEYLKVNNYPHEHSWLVNAMTTYESIVYRGNYTVKQYLVFNPLTGMYETADTEDNAVLLKNKIVNDYVVANVEPLIDTKIEIVEPDGTSATTSYVIK